MIAYNCFSLYYEPEEFYANAENLLNSDKGGVAVASGWKVKKIDVENRVAILDDDTEIKYEKCLIATGNKTKNSSHSFGEVNFFQ